MLNVIPNEKSDVFIEVEIFGKIVLEITVCVLGGIGGSCFLCGLKDREDCFHAYIYADKDFRAERIVRLYGESEKKPLARLEEKDKRRSANYQHYTGGTWGKSQNYDICLCSSTIGIEKCADIIVSLIKESK